VLGADGRASGARAVVPRTDLEMGRDPERERCVADAIARWEFPAPRAGGRIWLRIRGSGPEVERPMPACDPAGAAYAVDGFVKPRAKEQGCVQREVRVPSSAYVPAGLITAQFAVRADGTVGRFRMLTEDVSIPVAAAIAEAVERCEWIPGRDPDGKAATIWVILPLRFVRP
jgi:hypothetical protein